MILALFDCAHCRWTIVLIVVVILAEARVLNKGCQHLASSLQQRVSSNTIKDNK
jgi:hypothetical protein